MIGLLRQKEELQLQPKLIAIYCFVKVGILSTLLVVVPSILLELAEGTISFI